MQHLTMQSLNPYHRIDEDLAISNIRLNLEKHCQEFTPALCMNDGHFVIVGSGPSLPDFINEIREERQKGRTICAINGAHDFLCSDHLEPDLFVTCDPKTTILGNVKLKNDHTTYLLASRVHHEVYEHLKDKKIVMWHSAASAGPPKGQDWEGLNLTAECNEWKGRFAVGGGTTSGLRAVYLAYLMGFRKIIMYGMDSCLAPDKKTKRFSGENIGPNKPVDVIVNGKRFWANGAMALQASEFQEIYKHLPITFDIKGNGLLAEIVKARRQKGAWA